MSRFASSRVGAIASSLALAALLAPALVAAQDEPEDMPPPESSEATTASAPIEARPIEVLMTEEPAAGTEAVPSSEAREASDDAPPPSHSPGLLPDGSLDPCATHLRSRPIGPLQVSALDGQLGMPLRACPRDEVAIGGDALLVADADRFYGNIRASGRFRISARIDPNVEAFVSWEAFRYQLLLSSIDAHFIGMGYLSYGAAGRVYHAEGRVIAITGRLVLPTTTGLDQASLPLGLDVGVTAGWQADENFAFHGWLTLLGSIGVGTGPAEPRAGLRVGGGVDWRPYEWLAFVLEAQAGFGYLGTLDLVAAQAGVRLALGTEVGLELAASMPLFGVRAFDSGALPLAATLMLSWHLR
jgi:hypothetical protein